MSHLCSRAEKLNEFILPKKRPFNRYFPVGNKRFMTNVKIIWLMENKLQKTLFHYFPKTEGLLLNFLKIRRAGVGKQEIFVRNIQIRLNPGCRKRDSKKLQIL